jgi:hypothetical protein
MAGIAAVSLLLSASAVVSCAQRTVDSPAHINGRAHRNEGNFESTKSTHAFNARQGSTGTPDVILFIVADDLGWNDIYPESGIQTPVLNGLRDEGVTLGNYHVQPVCSPSRAALMTGRYPIAYGLQTYVVEDGAGMHT